MSHLPSTIGRFLSELRRRKVIHVGVTYAIVGAGVTEAANNLLGPLGVSPLLLNGIPVLVVTGFPVVLGLAWFFDITRSRGDGGANAGTAIGIGASGAAAQHAERPRPEGSIAAIPFVNLSGDPSQDFLGDGLTEELLVALSRVRGLHVAARTSSFAVRDSHQDIHEIGQRLGVRNIVEGSVRLAGRTLRLSVRLVEVDSGYSLWTETYEREMDDIFAVQSEIAHSIAERLMPHEAAAVTAGPPGPLAAPPEPAISAGTLKDAARPGTQNVDAFQHYLRGRFHWNRRTETDLRIAIGEFEQAVEADAEYASAYAGLADAYSLLLDYGGIAPAIGLGPARTAVERALALDPDLAEAWTSLALVREFERRWTDAESAFMKSIAMRPDYAVAHQRLALHLVWTGRDDDAVREARWAEQLDPLSVAVSASTGFVLYYARRYDEAVRQLRHTIATDPEFATAHVALGVTLLQSGDAKEAVEHFETAARKSGRAGSVLGGLACAYARVGDREAAEAIVVELRGKSDSDWVASYPLALAHAGMGDIEDALRELEEACDEGVPQMLYIAREPLLDPLRDSPRFKAILGRVGLDEA